MADESRDPRHDAVRKWYSERFALSRAPSYRPVYPTGHQGALGPGYDPKILDAAPTGLVEAFCGIENPFLLGPLTAGASILDVGCGAGFESAERVHWTGCDTSAETLGATFCARRPEGARFA